MKGDSMKRSDFTKYISIFILAVIIIAVYKTFDSIGLIFHYIINILAFFTPIVVAFAIAFILYPLCVRFENVFKKSKIHFVHNHRRGISIFLIYVLFVLAVAAFGSFLIPAIVNSISDFASQLPEIVRSVKRFLVGIKFGSYGLKDVFSGVTVSKVVSLFELDNLNIYLNSLLGASRVIVSLFLSIVISIYILADRGSLKTTVKKVSELVLPQKSRGVIIKYVKHTFDIMYKYIYCQFADAFIVFVIALVLLLAMGVSYAPVLALFIGIFNIIPYFGAITAGVITALLTMITSSVSKGLWVAAALIIIQQIDANLIQPRLVKDALEVKPFWVLCGVSVCGGLFGILGIVLAVPLMALIGSIFNDYYEYIKEKKNENNAPKTVENSINSEFNEE